MLASPGVPWVPGFTKYFAARTGPQGLALVVCLGTACPNPLIIACLSPEKAKVFPIAEAQLPPVVIGGNGIGAGALGRIGDRRSRGLFCLGGGIWFAGFAAMLLGIDPGGSNNLPLPLDDSLDGFFTACLWLFLHIITDEDPWTFPGFDLDSLFVGACSGCFGDNYIFNAIVRIFCFGLGSLEEHSFGESSSTTFVL